MGVSNYYIALEPIRASFLLSPCLGESFEEVLILFIKMNFGQ